MRPLLEVAHTDPPPHQLRPLLCGLLVILAAAVGFPTMGTEDSWAATGHGFVSSWTQAGHVALSEPAAVAVDRATGVVFVADTGAGVVYVYNLSGGLVARLGGGSLLASGVAVDEASGLVYVADTFSNAVLVFDPDGSGGYAQVGEWSGAALPGEEFGEVLGVAVDNSGGPSAGDVYVVDGEDPEMSEGVVDVFKPRAAGPEEGLEGSLVRVLSKGKMEEPNGVAVDSSSGRVYVADSETGGVLEYSATGVLEGRLIGSSSPIGAFGKEGAEGDVSGVAVDPTSGDLLVAEAEAGVVTEFNQAGEWVGWITSSESAPLGEPRGVAVTGSGGVFVGDPALARVDIYGPGVVVADVSTGKATKVARTSAILNGALNGLGEPGHYFFQWGTTTALGSSSTPTAFGGGEEPVAVGLGELHASSTYYYRLVAEDQYGASYGAIRQLMTPTAVEGLTTGPVTSLQPESAMLTGSLSPDGFDAHYYFQWGTTTSYGQSSPEPPGIDAGTGKEAVKAEAALSGLAPNTVYHYRLVAENQLGVTLGADQQFQTSGPPRIVEKPVTGVGHEAATLNATVNPDELATSYHFEYGETTSYGSEAPLGGASVGAGATPVPVSASLTGLKLGVSYHYRVVATNSDDITTGPDQTFTTVPPALITTSATEVKATEATLQTEVNPLGHDTTYYFQYGAQPCQPDPEACTSSPVPPGEDIGAGEQPITKTLTLTNLTPDSTYHYRVVAINSLGTSEGAEYTITTPRPTQTFALPDDRAWEMVTPPDKEGAPVEALTREGGVILASEDGNKLTYVTDGALGEAEGNRAPESQQILATRGATSWTNQDIETPIYEAQGLEAGFPPEYRLFTPDLSLAVVEPSGQTPYSEPPLAPEEKQRTIYARTTASGSFIPLVSEANVAPGLLFGGQVHFVGASSDLTHVVISANVALGGAETEPGLYEWSAGRLDPVSVMPNAAPATGRVELGYFHDTAAAISQNGSRVIWTKPEEEEKLGHLYVRDSVTEETVQVDRAQGVSEPAGTGSAQFEGASADGSRIFFLDRKPLTPGSTSEPAYRKADLYECLLVSAAGHLQCELRDLTVGTGGEPAAVAGLLLGVSEDGKTVFLVAKGVLGDGEANGRGESASPGGDNLYMLQETVSGWNTTFIGTLASADSPEWEGNRLADQAFVTARVSPSGRYFAFMSEMPLTGYDNVDASPEAKGARDEEVFLYDAATSSLTCVSCNPTGARPAGVLDRTSSGEGVGLVIDRRKVWAELGHEHWLGGNIPGWTADSLVDALIQPRYLNNDGQLYFNSPDELVPAATNHKANVYEYEPAGVGSCESPTGGCVALLSSGSSSHESAFIEATPSGSDVFIITAANLLPQDTDTAFDIYDVRTCTTASPCQTTPVQPQGPCASTETCRPASLPVEIPAGGPGTATFSGPSNPSPPAHPQTQVEAVKTIVLTRAQRLAKGLQACRRAHPHSSRRRRACEAHARKLYGKPPAKPTRRHPPSPGKDGDRK
jgi:DNA-binding beta-propeller fold protein YncE